MAIDLVKSNQYLIIIEKYNGMIIHSKPFKWLISMLVIIAILGILIIAISDDSISNRQCDQLAINGIISNVTDCVTLKQMHRRDELITLLLYSLLSSRSSYDDDDDY